MKKQLTILGLLFLLIGGFLVLNFYVEKDAGITGSSVGIEGYEELFEKRTYNTKTFDLGGGSYATEIHSGNLFFFDGDGYVELENISYPMIEKKEKFFDSRPNRNLFDFGSYRLHKGVDFFIEDENIVLVDANGERIFVLPRPFSTDAEGDVSLDRYVLDFDEGTRELGVWVEVDESWLNNAVYPIVVDPDVQLNFSTGVYDGHILLEESYYYQRGDSLNSSYIGSSIFTLYRGFMEFNTSRIPNSTTITGVNLTFTTTFVFGGGPFVNITSFNRTRILGNPVFVKDNGCEDIPANSCGNARLYRNISGPNVLGNTRNFYRTGLTEFQSVGTKTINLGTSASKDLEAQLSDGYFGIGLLPYWSGLTNNYTLFNSSRAGSGQPYLTVYYIDSTPPVFSPALQNQFLTFENWNWSYNITANDNTGIDSYSINWTNTFKINRTTGVVSFVDSFNPITPEQYYYINVSANDTSGNRVSGVFSVYMAGKEDCWNLTGGAFECNTNCIIEDEFITIRGDAFINPLCNLQLKGTTNLLFDGLNRHIYVYPGGQMSLANTSAINRPKENFLRMFVTFQRFDGNLGGIAGADAICNADYNKPSSSEHLWKAFIVTDERQVGQPYWILKPNTTYGRTDYYTTIGTTLSNGWFSLNRLEDSLENSILGSGGGYFWWGGNINGSVNLNYTCNSWTSTSGSGILGHLLTFNPFGWQADNYRPCDGSDQSIGKGFLVCVEYPKCTSDSDCEGTDVCNLVSGECQTSYKRIFLTASSYYGDLGGVSGADAKCMADANKPSGGTWKALVGTANRQVGGSDWVLMPNMQYRRTDGSTIIGITNASAWWPYDSTNFSTIFSTGLHNPPSADLYYPFTGLSYNGKLGAYNCINWTFDDPDNYADDNPYAGYTLANSTIAFGGLSSGYCYETSNLYCVEQ